MFNKFASLTAARFKELSNKELFRVNIEPDALWLAYLAAFPEGSNPIYKTNTYHDGTYDKQTLRKIGNVVAINGGKLVSIWDTTNLDYPYDVVADTLKNLVESATIVSVFRTKEATFGYVQTTQQLPEGQIKVWDHFHFDIASRHQTAEVDTVVGNLNTTRQVFQRGLDELTLEALDTVIELIDANNLYRGAEHRSAVVGFRSLARSQDPLTAWENLAAPVARFRNTVIGTLVDDLSQGKPLQAAVGSFESKVAPANYKRPTALITQAMVDKAVQTLQALDLEDAIERRHAVLQDVSINNVLWASNTARRQMQGVKGLLASSIKVKEQTAEDISIDDFLANVLPRAESMELRMKGQHQGNLMTLTAPVHKDVKPLFKWDNNFAWSYNGNVTDSIKERVKAAGGNIKADLRISLSWFNHDDLDLHCESPYGHVSFRNKCGILDVDMQAGGGTTMSPVENLAFNSPKNGGYRVLVNQWAARHDDNTGFVLEMEIGGVVKQFSYTPKMRSGETITAFTFTIVDGKMHDFTLAPGFDEKGISQVVWGVTTETFVPVSFVMLSPNHWDQQATGNKHTFVMLDGCKTTDAMRGIYNEFLRNELTEHGKVFETLASKTKCPVSDEQLSGVGFSSTKPDQVEIKVVGQKLNKVYSVSF